MDKKIAGLLGAVAAVGAIGTAQASAAPAPTDVLRANSYADLLEPIPNAAKVLQALDEQSPQADEPKVQLAQWYHHHHHHHHGYWRGRGYGDGYGYGYGYGPRVYVVPPRRYYHHHHHHHHHWRYDRY